MLGRVLSYPQTLLRVVTPSTPEQSPQPINTTSSTPEPTKTIIAARDGARSSEEGENNLDGEWVEIGEEDNFDQSRQEIHGISPLLMTPPPAVVLQYQHQNNTSPSTTPKRIAKEVLNTIIRKASDPESDRLEKVRSSLSELQMGITRLEKAEQRLEALGIDLDSLIGDDVSSYDGEDMAESSSPDSGYESENNDGLEYPPV